MAEQDTWVVSDNEEQWSNGEEYASKESAIAGAVDDLDLEPGQRFWVGRKVAVKWPSGLYPHDAILDCAREYFDEEVGEVCDDWPQCTPEQGKIIEGQISALVKDWLSEIGEWPPRFWKVEGAEDHLAPGGE